MNWPAEAIWEAVSPLLPGFSVEILPEIDSTNTELMRRARAGSMEPVLLVAEYQSAGRGRMGRGWLSSQFSGLGDSCAAPLSPNGADSSWGEEPDGDGASGPPSLTFSLGLPLAPQDWSGLSLAVGLSIVQTLHPRLQLKWPNDVWLDGRKLGGILIETASIGAERYVVIGIGINIVAPDGTGLRTPPAGLRELLAGVQANDVLEHIVAPLVRAVQRFAVQGFGPLVAAYQERDLLYGREVLCSDGATGTALGVDASGALLVHTEDGLRKITSAEVSVRPVSPDRPATPA